MWALWSACMGCINSNSKSNHISSCKFFVYFVRKNLLFLFYTSTFIKHPHQFIYSTHLFNKIFIFFTFSYYFIPSPLWHRLITSSSPSTPTPSQPPFNKIRPLIHWSSTTTTTTQQQSQQQWFTDLPQQQSQQQRHNHNKSDPLTLHVRSILCHRLRFQTDCWIGEADRRSQLTCRPNLPIGLSSCHARSPLS